MHDKTTELIHHPYQAPAGFAAPQLGVYKASTVIFANTAELRSRDWKHKTGYTYGLHGTPTTFALEERLCALEGGLQCLLTCSGLAAVALVNMALLRAGDEVLIPSNAYGPSKALAEGELAAWGIGHQLYDPLQPADLAAKISAKTKLVWLEVPGSVSMEFPDLPALLRVCRAANTAQRSIVTALDNTWGAGLAFNAFDVLAEGGLGSAVVGADISIQALTKYPSGGGDVLMGSVVTRNEALHLRLKATHMRTGMGVGAKDVEAVLRSLPSMALRYAAHDAAGRALAQWLSTQPEVAQVLHPALPGAPGHAHWQQLCRSGQAAGLFSVVFQPRYSPAQVDAFCDALRLFKLGFSWGGPMSLVVPYDMPSMRGKAWPYAGVLVRFSLGLEAVADLQADLQAALAQMA